MDPDYTLSFSWATTNATQIRLEGDSASFPNLPPNGSQADFPSPVVFACPAASETYTLTVVGANGVQASQSVTVTNIGETGD